MAITATGGSVSTDGSYTVHKFTSDGTFEVTAGSGTVNVLTVGAGGGAGGGSAFGGGGGGGEVKETTGISVYI